MNKSILRHRKWGLVIVGALLAISIFVFAIRIEATIGWEQVFSNLGGSKVVAYVNGESITLQDLELAKNIRASNQPELDIGVLYQQAMNGIVRHHVLVQEAQRRGLEVSDEEVQAYFNQVREIEKDQSEILEMHDQQRKALGLTKQAYEKRLLAVYKETLLVEKLYQLWEVEAPIPMEAEVDIFLAKQPEQNVLILIPITFDDSSLARLVYQELQALSANMVVDEFEIKLAETVHRYNEIKPGAFIHQKFVFTDEGELPDYAYAALGEAEGTLGLFEREDGSSVVYYVLKSVETSAEEARLIATQWLSQEMRASYLLDMEQLLINQAKVDFIVKNLPEAARGIAKPGNEP